MIIVIQSKLNNSIEITLCNPNFENFWVPSMSSVHQNYFLTLIPSRTLYITREQNFFGLFCSWMIRIECVIICKSLKLVIWKMRAQKFSDLCENSVVLVNEWRFERTFPRYSNRNRRREKVQSGIAL